MPDLTPPSAVLLPPPAVLRERLAVALREVDLLRRLVRVVEAVRLASPIGPTPARQEGPAHAG